MDMPHGRVPEATPTAYDDLETSILSPLDPAEALDLHRAINERRAQMENPELLRHLRSL
ncbi:MAG: hypothetical protein KKE02_04120 [Alphaproteobacteria bacterium]|nr:hypothetical protein [Alphaproteobacteria bacterium]MBU1513609.1 hypothetical protein [Alphaproteobacteria bacterium]MBU2094746.1 hypothetical protein [Alphaproteobacteria bacterium]MBU2150185.1 hypothetical protein [Alphaproteobacteria bacterium]MBU2309286.1 hypothetical protein [Alphaproteobacteria bacterium]